jgi:hypothetical protein
MFVYILNHSTDMNWQTNMKKEKRKKEKVVDRKEMLI